jgi:O-antigen/teichoic acid export membrane protein
MLAPLISELHATRRIANLQGIMTRSARGIFAFTALVSLGLAVLGEPLLRLFGPEFDLAYEPLLILLIGQTVNAGTGPVGYLMTMTGHQKPAAWRVGVATALTLTLDLLLIPKLGLDGAAIANALGTSLLNLAMLVYVTRRLRINPTILGRTFA